MGDLAPPIVGGDEDAGTQRERRRDVQNIQGLRGGAGGIFCGESPGIVENRGEATGGFSAGQDSGQTPALARAAED